MPASLPAAVSSLRQGLGFAWRSLMGEELMMIPARHHRLGYVLGLGRSMADASQVVAVMLIMTGLAMPADRYAFAAMERMVRKRFGRTVEGRRQMENARFETRNTRRKAQAFPSDLGSRASDFLFGDPPLSAEGVAGLRIQAAGRAENGGVIVTIPWLAAL